MRQNAFRIALIATFVAILVLVPTALAGKGGGGKGGGGGGGGTGGSTTSPYFSPRMVFDANGNGAPNWSDVITFNVSPGVTSQPWVRLDCYQSGVWVSTASHGFFPSYLWAPNFTLRSGGWMGGAADCKATLYKIGSNGRASTISTLMIHVDA
jgi:hypothetical protein